MIYASLSSERTGNIWLPGKAFSKFVIGGCFKVLARELKDVIERDKDNLYVLRCVATVGCMCDHCWILRRTMRHWKGSINHIEYLHVPLMLSVIFKTN